MPIYEEKEERAAKLVKVLSLKQSPSNGFKVKTTVGYKRLGDLYDLIAGIMSPTVPPEATRGVLMALEKDREAPGSLKELTLLLSDNQINTLKKLCKQAGSDEDQYPAMAQILLNEALYYKATEGE